MLVDAFGRTIDYLRVSVTDRCNLRCEYCMPAEGMPRLAHADILSYEEIEAFVKAAVAEGIRHVRLTGGEPLARLGVVNIPWYEYPDLMPDPARFVRLVEEEAGNKARTVLLICRSGKRTVEAGQALEAAGFTDVLNILHGFEGELDEHFKRSTLNGWRFAGLPWEQM